MMQTDSFAPSGPGKIGCSCLCLYNSLVSSFYSTFYDLQKNMIGKTEPGVLLRLGARRSFQKGSQAFF